MNSDFMSAELIASIFMQHLAKLGLTEVQAIYFAIRMTGCRRAAVERICKNVLRNMVVEGRAGVSLFSASNAITASDMVRAGLPALDDMEDYCVPSWYE